MQVQDHVIDLIPAYALNCLDEAEAAPVAEHLKRCPDCREELRAYQSVVDQLPLAVPQVEPSPRVWQDLLARVEKPSALDKPPSVMRRFANSLGGASPVWGLVGLALVVVLMFSNLVLWRQVRQLQASPQATALRVVNLEGTQFSPGAGGMLVLSRNGEYGTLVVDHLPALSPQQQYQLWLIQDGQRTSGGVFSVSPEGYASLVVSSPRPLDDYGSFGITIEPAGGSPGPTGEKVLGGNL